MSVRNFFAILISIILLFAAEMSASGQVHSSTSFRYLLNESDLKEYVGFMASAEMAGRAAGSSQAKETADYIASKFESFGLLHFNGIDYRQQFRILASKRVKAAHQHKSSHVQGPQDLEGHNVIGYVPAKEEGADFIIVGAHYDHIGSYGDKFYPGADDNASGVAALLELAKAFAARYREKNDLNHNFVFVAFDGNNHNMQGSKAFLKKKGIPAERISCMINIDQIGSTLSPVGEFDEYILVLGADKLEPWKKEQLDFANEYFGLDLCIDYSYYGSQQFYDIFYRLSDQYSFTELGVPALLFTSGITKHTNKESDTPDTLRYDVLLRRIDLIYRFLWLID